MNLDSAASDRLRSSCHLQGIVGCLTKERPDENKLPKDTLTSLSKFDNRRFVRWLGGGPSIACSGAVSTFFTATACYSFQTQPHLYVCLTRTLHVETGYRLGTNAKS